MRYLTLYMFSLILVGCGVSALPPEDFMKWAESDKSGLHQVVKNEKYKLTAFYQPAEYLAIGDMELDSMNQSSFNERMKTYGQKKCFVVRFEPLSGHEFSREMDNTGYFQSDDGIGKDFTLIVGNKKYTSSFGHFEKGHGLTAFDNLVLVFDTPNTSNLFNDDIILAYNDQNLGLGNVRFRFDKTDINNIPTIKF